jgi:O-antigen/teichoic acid export membrane protein
VTYRKQGVRILPWLTAITAAVNVVLNWLLLPRYGIQGAAWATLASNSVLALLALVIGQRIAPVPYRWGRWSAIITLSAVGLWLLTMIEHEVASVMLRYALKLGWLGLFALCVVKMAGVKLHELRPRAPGSPAT